MFKSLPSSTTFRNLSVCSAIAWSASCGGAPPAPAAPPPAPPPPAPAAVVAADTADAPEPSYVVGLLRWKSPEASLATVNQWIGMHWTGPMVAAEVLDKSMADAIAFDAPVDAVVALDPKSNDFAPLAAVSVGVRSLEAARSAAQAMGSVSEVRPGEYRVSLRHGRRKGDKPFCILRAAVGPAPARFVCGSRERDVSALSGYMARTLPTRDFGSSDLHIELRAAPAMDLYGTLLKAALRSGTIAGRSKLEIGEPPFDRGIDAAASGISEELIALAGDLDSMTIDSSIAPDHTDARLAIRMKGQQSWTSGTLADAGAHAAAAPPMFWHLPINATRAGFQYSADVHRFDAIRHTIGDLLDGWLAHEGISQGDRAPLTALFGDKLVADSTYVTASGAFTPIDQPASKKTTSAASANPLQDALDGSGWYLVGVSAPNQSADAVKTLALGLGRAKIQALIRSKLASLDSPHEGTPAVASTGPVLTMKSVAPPKELRKGSLDFEVALARDVLRDSTARDKAKSGPKAKPVALGPLKVHVLVVPEPTQTWIALGADRAQLVKTVLAAADGAPESGTLAARQDLGALKSGKFVSAGFFTLESFLQSWVSVLTHDPDAARKLEQTRSMLASAPNKGKTPVFETAEIAQADGIALTVRADVPKGFIEDVIVFVTSLGLSGLAGP